MDQMKAIDGTTALSDEQVVLQVLSGHTAMFEVLMRRHNERLYRAARAILRDDSEVEDVMQQAYVNAYSHLGQFDGRARFSTWLTRITVHEALGRARRRGRYITMDPETPSARVLASVAPGPDPEHLAFSHELGALLESAIERLPDGTREVFVLRQIEGMSTEEVATALEVSEDVIKTRLSRARAALRRQLSDQAGSVATGVFRFAQPRCDRIVAAVFARLFHPAPAGAVIPMK